MRVYNSLSLSPSRPNWQPARASLTLVGLLALLSATACSPKPVNDEKAATSTPQSAPTVAAIEATPPASQVASAPEKVAAKNTPPKADEGAAGGSATSIAGGWVNAGGACDSGASVQFNPDGTYMSEGENGTWSLDGKTLTVTTNVVAEAERAAQTGPEQSTGDVGEKAVLTLLNVGETSANVILSNGTNARWTRCSR
jgi:hypothetical protein